MKKYLKTLLEEKGIVIADQEASEEGLDLIVKHLPKERKRLAKKHLVMFDFTNAPLYVYTDYIDHLIYHADILSRYPNAELAS